MMMHQSTKCSFKGLHQIHRSLLALARPPTFQANALNQQSMSLHLKLVRFRHGVSYPQQLIAAEFDQLLAL